MTASPEILSLADGRDISVRIRHSRRARPSFCMSAFTTGRSIVLPPGASAPEGLGFAATQISWVADQLSRIGDAVPLPTARSFLY